jgi:hypothetical protein
MWPWRKPLGVYRVWITTDDTTDRCQAYLRLPLSGLDPKLVEALKSILHHGETSSGHMVNFRIEQLRLIGGRFGYWIEILDRTITQAAYDAIDRYALLPPDDRLEFDRFGEIERSSEWVVIEGHKIPRHLFSVLSCELMIMYALSRR